MTESVTLLVTYFPDQSFYPPQDQVLNLINFRSVQSEGFAVPRNLLRRQEPVRQQQVQHNTNASDSQKRSTTSRRRMMKVTKRAALTVAVQGLLGRGRGRTRVRHELLQLTLSSLHLLQPSLHPSLHPKHGRPPTPPHLSALLDSF